MIEVTVDIAELKKLKVHDHAIHISATHTPYQFTPSPSNLLSTFIISRDYYFNRNNCMHSFHLCVVIKFFFQVAELKRKLAELGLDNKGTKAELIARVEKYLTEQGVLQLGLGHCIFFNDVIFFFLHSSTVKVLITAPL